MPFKKFLLRFLILGLSGLAFLGAPAKAGPPLQQQAQDKGGVVDIISASRQGSETAGQPFFSEAPTHPDLHLSPDRSELIHLDADAATVVLGNPNHLSILAENARTLILVPKAAGATYFTVLGRGGHILMQRHVVIAGPSQKYVRIRRSCNTSTAKNCQATQVYYCPDMCHEIMMEGATATGAATPVTANGTTAPGPTTAVTAPPAVPVDTTDTDPSSTR